PRGGAMTDVMQQETTQETPAARAKRRRTRWSWSIGEQGETVCVFRERNGRLYGQVGGRQGRRAALRNSKTEPGWRDTPENRERAKTWARAQHKTLVDGLVRVGDPTPTIARLAAAYVAAQKDVDLDRTSREENKRCGELFARA